MRPVIAARAYSTAWSREPCGDGHVLAVLPAMASPSSDTTRAGVLAPFHAFVTHTSKIAKSFGRRAAFHDLQHRLVNRVMPYHVMKGMTATLDRIDRKLLDAGGLQTRFATRDELLAAAAGNEVGEEMSASFV